MVISLLRLILVELKYNILCYILVDIKIKMFYICICWCSFFYSNILLGKLVVVVFKL